MNIVDLTLSELCLELAKGNLTSREITEAYLKRAHETETEVNAYINLYDELALEAADRADLDKSKSAIHKLPFAVKDNIAVSGMKMTCASRMLENFTPTYTATCVSKVGDIVIGKTNLDEFAMGSSCEKSIIGATHNPIRHGYASGGSSGGSAAAVAVKSAPWAIGTDTGGSARQPSSFCGVVSIKPTYSLVSRFGVAELASSLDTVCPITKNVYDNALVLETMSGWDRRDMTSCKREDYTGEFTRELCKTDSLMRGLRVGLMAGFEELCDDVVVDKTLRAARKLEQLGAVVERVHIRDFDAVLGAYLVISQAELSSNLSRYDGLKYGLQAEGDSFREIMTNSRDQGFGDEVKRRILSGTYALSEAHGGNFYGEVKMIRTDINHWVEKMWEKCDVLLTPTASGVSFKLNSYDTDPTKLYRSDIFTVLANLTGSPAIQLPSGGDGTLPCGISLMSPKFTEKLLYKTAYILESELAPYVKSEVANVK